MDIIWERQIDLDAQRRGFRLFWLLYGAPTALVICMGGLVLGPGGACGLLILLGSLGSMIFFAIWLTSRTARTHTVIGRRGEELVWAQQRVRIDQIERINVQMKNASMSMVGITGSHTAATAALGVAEFFLADGSSVEFVFPELSQRELNELRVALEGALPGMNGNI